MKYNVESAKHGYFYDRFGSPLDFALGPVVRVLLAMIILVAFGLWAYSNKSVVTDELKAMQGRSIDPTEIAAGDPVRAKVIVPEHQRKDAAVQDLAIKQAPNLTTLLGAWNAAAAGLLLLISAFFRGKMLGIAVILGAFFAIFGTFFTTALNQWAILGIGMGIGVLGINFFRET